MCGGHALAEPTDGLEEIFVERNATWWSSVSAFSNTRSSR
jgi:hypothetical protein